MVRVKTEPSESTRMGVSSSLGSMSRPDTFWGWGWGAERGGASVQTQGNSRVQRGGRSVLVQTQGGEMS